MPTAEAERRSITSRRVGGWAGGRSQKAEAKSAKPMTDDAMFQFFPIANAKPSDRALAPDC